MCLRGGFPALKKSVQTPGESLGLFQGAQEEKPMGGGTGGESSAQGCREGLSPRVYKPDNHCQLPVNRGVITLNKGVWQNQSSSQRTREPITNYCFHCRTAGPVTTEGFALGARP